MECSYFNPVPSVLLVKQTKKPEGFVVSLEEFLSK
jgi:hypothetical protein